MSRFGWRLYRHFFKAYNEKVWGVPASELSADWGAQRIKDLSLFQAIKDATHTEASRQPRQVEDGDEPDRRVQLPEVRAGNDVGGRDREGRDRGREDRVRPARHRDPARSRRRDRSRCRRRRRRRARLSVHARHLVDADRRAVQGDGSAGRRADATRPRPICATATTSPWRSSSRRNSRSPTTGSTSTTPTSRSAACRTSVRGRRSWSRTAAPASGWSTS